MSTHTIDEPIGLIIITNDCNKLVSIQCNKAFNNSAVNKALYTNLGLLPGESITYYPTDLLENEQISITITETFPGNHSQTTPEPETYIFKYSAYTNESVSIYTSKKIISPQGGLEHFNQNHIRYIRIKNPADGNGYDVKLKVCYTKPNEGEQSYTFDERVQVGTSETFDLLKIDSQFPNGTAIRIEAIIVSSGRNNAKGSETFYIHKDSTRKAEYIFSCGWFSKKGTIKLDKYE